MPSLLKKALVTGITGQDGSYLTELLLAKGYEVHGIVRRVSTFNRQRIDAFRDGPASDRLHLHYGDLGDSSSLNRIVRNVVPDEIYNLGAQSHVGISFETPEYTTNVTAVGAVRLLDAIRNVGLHPLFYQASSSEMFGKVAETPQRETTPFHPVREFCERSFACAGITLAWEGEGVDEIGRCTKTGKILVHVDQRYFRPAEVDFLLGDPSKAKRLLGWEPKVTFEGLVEMMTKADLDLAAIESGPRTRN